MHIALADMEIYHHTPLYPFTHSWQAWTENSIVFVDANLPTIVIEHAIKLAIEKNLKICIDPVSVPKAKALPAHLNHVYLIKPDLLEATAITGIAIHSINDCIHAGQVLHERGVENVVISLGKSGYVIVNKHTQEYIETMIFSEIVDVTGAGDAFIAGILLGLQQSSNIKEACQMGAAAAAYTIQSDKTVAEDITISRLQAYIHNQNVLKEHANAAIL
jgi:pseudouridine kinase